MIKSEERELRLKSCNIRKGIIESVYNAKSGHPGGSLSAADLFTYLYFKEINVDSKDHKSDNRDRFVLSKGHTAPGLYSTLANKGFFPIEDLKTLRKIDSYLQGHPNMNTVPGIDMSTGSLGQGISTAVGMAKGAKYRNLDCRVYTLLGDGELQEGQVWEALMFASHYKLDNLCVIIDNNGLQIDGKIDDVMSPYPIVEKLESFGCEVKVIDGHNFNELEEAFKLARKTIDKPFAIVMKTIKGKGISFMENKEGWHGKAPNKEEYDKAMNELNEEYARWEAK